MPWRRSNYKEEAIPLLSARTAACRSSELGALADEIGPEPTMKSRDIIALHLNSEIVQTYRSTRRGSHRGRSQSHGDVRGRTSAAFNRRCTTTGCGNRTKQSGGSADATRDV